MGGRGQSGKTTSKDILSAKLRAALGVKGSPKTTDEALTINPNYQRGWGWQTNCQRTAYTYEMARRGYDVEALAEPSGYDPYENGGWKHGFEDQQWNRFYLYEKTQVKKAIDQKMAEWGEGSRALVYVVWEGGGAHLFNAEYHNGVVRGYDAQNGRSFDIRSEEHTSELQSR